MIRSTFLNRVLIAVLTAASLPCWSASAQAASAAGGGSEAWTGVITYSKTQTLTDNKTVDRVSGRGKDTRNWEMTYDYKATVGVLESPEKNGTNVGKASITHSLTSTETNTAVERNSCDKGKTWQEMTGEFFTQAKTTGQGKEEANVNVGLNSDGTYTVSVGTPQIAGEITGSESSTFSGQCTKKEGKKRTLPPMPTTIQGNSLTSDGSHRVNPDDPDRLSGSYSMATPGGVVEKISWNLQRHVPPLHIMDLKYEDMRFPKWDDWHEITDQKGTTDGNWVKIKATVFNGSHSTRTAELYLKETYKGDKWDGAKPDVTLKDQTFSITLDPGETREIEMIWDSSGYSWFDDGRPRLLQRFRAELWEKSKKVDEMTKNLKVRPKPILMVAGIWSNPGVYDYYQNLFTTTHSYDWKAEAVLNTSYRVPVGGEGEVKEATGHRTLHDQADNLKERLDEVRSSLNAWHVDMLAHCTGGLVARLYVHKQMEVLPDGLPVVKHLMMAGTPNNGVPCADTISQVIKNWEPTAKELMPEEMSRFNQYVTQRKGTKFSALIGDSVPVQLCVGPQWNDGFVSVESAKYGIEDVVTTSSLHPDLLTTEAFGNFVRPRVITGPKGTYPMAGPSKL